MRRILHCDMDCFYAAVEVRDDPALVGKPVIVGGRPKSRGVVAACNYEARAFGVHSAMPSAQAGRLCPDAVFLRPSFERYRMESRAIFSIFRSYTPLVEGASLDEAYLDVTDQIGPLGSATAIAEAIRAQVKADRGLTVSVGVGPSKLIAKIASDWDKPDGLTVIKPHQVLAFLEPLAVRKLHGIGPAAEKRLAAIGVGTVAELRSKSLDELLAHFGRWGRRLHEIANGIDHREVNPHQTRKSIGSEETYAENLMAIDEIQIELDRFAEEVAESLDKRTLQARTLTLKLRYDDFETISRSRTFDHQSSDVEVFRHAARTLLESTEAGKRAVRLLGLTASNLEDASHRQLSLFGE